MLVERIQALDDDERMFFVEHLQVYAENLADDEAIPESIDDPIYARMREHGREYVPRLKSLLRRLAMPGAAGLDDEPE